MLRRPPVLALGFLGAALCASPTERALAQAAPSIEVRGSVVDDQTGEPIAGATVIFSDSNGQRLGRRVTDGNGEFGFDVRHRTGVRLRAGRIGYRYAETPFLPFRGADLLVVEVRLSTEAVLLAPLEIVARSEAVRSPIVMDFDRRARDGFGSYFTRADIERIRPGRVSDLLVSIPGVRLETGGGRGHASVVTMARSPMGMGGGACPVQVFLDGRLMTRGNVTQVPVDDLATPDAVEGIEIYRGLSTVPPEFLTPNSRCGVIAIWTRRGGR